MLTFQAMSSYKRSVLVKLADDGDCLGIECANCPLGRHIGPDFNQLCCGALRTAGTKKQQMWQIRDHARKLLAETEASEAMEKMLCE